MRQQEKGRDYEHKDDKEESLRWYLCTYLAKQSSHAAGLRTNVTASLDSGSYSPDLAFPSALEVPRLES